MSIYVAFDGPLDQYFMTYPRNLFDKPVEAAHVSFPLFQCLPTFNKSAEQKLTAML